MKTNWQTKKLGEICTIIKGKNLELFKEQRDEMLPYLGAKFMRGTKDAEFASVRDKKSVLVSEKDLIIICDGSKSGDIFSGFKGILSSTMGKMDFNENELDSIYLKSFLDLNFELFNGSKKGAAIPHLDFTVFKNLEIPLPPLATQRKIVAILDEKFAKLREAKQLRQEATLDTEKILATTLREIFEEGKEKGWEEKTFEEVLNFKTGKLDSNAMVSGGKYPFFTCAQKTYEIDSYSFDQKAVLLAGNNAAGKYSVKFYDGKFNAYQRTYVISVKDEKQLDYTYLTNFISHILNDLRDLSVGANTKFLTMKVLNKITIPVPPLAEQQKIVTRLDELSEKLRTLRELQQSQLEDMKKLEKAYLREAFKGDLV